MVLNFLWVHSSFCFEYVLWFLFSLLSLQFLVLPSVHFLSLHQSCLCFLVQLWLTSCFILVAVGFFISLYFLCHFLKFSCILLPQAFSPSLITSCIAMYIYISPIRVSVSIAFVLLFKAVEFCYVWVIFIDFVSWLKRSDFTLHCFVCAPCIWVMFLLTLNIDGNNRHFHMDR